MGLREELSYKYLRGKGVEIGALAWPLQVSELAHVTYVDRLPRKQLLIHYPDAPAARVAEPDIICEGATLDSINDSSLDFLVANHLLEHLPDPLKALDNWFRVLRPMGILYLAVPDMQRTFDVDRPPTSLDHVIADSSDSRERDPRIDFVHFLEWVTYVHHRFGHKPIPKAELYKEAEKLQRHCAESHGSIHFHTFQQETMLQVLSLTEKRCGARLVEFSTNEPSNEFISILQKL